MLFYMYITDMCMFQAGLKENAYEMVKGDGFPQVALLRSWESTVGQRTCGSDTDCYIACKRSTKLPTAT